MIFSDETIRDERADEVHDWHRLERDNRVEREEALGTGTLQWIETDSPQVLGYRNGRVSVFCNFGEQPVSMPAGDVIASSVSGATDTLEPGHAVWLTPAN